MSAVAVPARRQRITFAERGRLKAMRRGAYAREIVVAPSSFNLRPAVETIDAAEQAEHPIQALRFGDRNPVLAHAASVYNEAHRTVKRAAQKARMENKRRRGWK